LDLSVAFQVHQQIEHALICITHLLLHVQNVHEHVWQALVINSAGLGGTVFNQQLEQQNEQPSREHSSSVAAVQQATPLGSLPAPQDRSGKHHDTCWNVKHVLLLSCVCPVQATTMLCCEPSFWAAVPWCLRLVHLF